MTLSSLLILMGIAMVGFQFWQFRASAEQMHVYMRHYCKQQDLQLLSLARQHAKPSIRMGQIGWLMTYQFEFSGNGEDASIGIVTAFGKKIIDIDLPAYKI